MILTELQRFIQQELTPIYPKTEVDSFFYFLIEDRLDLQRIDLVLKPNFQIESKKISQLKIDISRLKKEEPIQYILGKTEFYSLPFLVDKNTLIPRPETEELVSWILEEVTNIISNLSSSLKINAVEKSLKILDIGTGTGCIPISLAKNLKDTEISAIDISSEALKIAEENAKLNNVKVAFFKVDILQAKKLEKSFDIIVSNPPYIRELEKVEIKKNVLQNEPHLALFVEDQNPLLFYTKIVDLAKKHLTENGILFFEINQYLAKETIQLLKEKGFKNIELKKDIFENDRMIKAQIH